MATTTTVARPRARGRQPARPGIDLSLVARYLVLIGVGLILFAPFILAFLGTFKTDAEIIAFPPTLVPERWLVENWPRFFSTDLGGIARPLGAISLGMSTGLFAAFLTLLLTGLSSELAGAGMSRRAGIAISVALAIVAGLASAFYLQWRLPVREFNAVLMVTAGAAVAVIMLIGVAILAMSAPDWRRVILSLAASLVVGAVVSVLVELISYAAGGGTFIRWLFNTALLAVLVACFKLVFDAMAAYAFARLRFPGKELVFSFVLATMMIPGAVTLVPAYVLMAKLSWINTAYSLVIPGIVSAFGIFLLTQFLKAVPRDLEEAAYIDGASYFQTFKDVILPLARPALLTLFIIEFQGMWNAFLQPLLYLNTPDMWVLNVALMTFQQQYKAAWNLTLVGAMVNAIPVLILFFIFSRYYMEGVSYAGVKG